MIPGAGKVNLFIKPVLSDRDKMNGFCFNVLQMTVLQMELTTIAEQLVHLTIEDPTPPGILKFAQEHGYLTGQRELLQTLILRSDESEKILATDAQTPQL